MIIAFLTALSMLCDSFVYDKINSIPEEIGKARHAVIEEFERDGYAEDYGGHYVEGGRIAVVVCLTGEADGYASLAQQYPCISFRQVQYSYEELLEYLRRFDEEVAPLLKDIDDLSAQISEQYNCIALSIPKEQHTLENVCRIREAAGDIPIVFQPPASVHIF